MEGKTQKKVGLKNTAQKPKKGAALSVPPKEKKEGGKKTKIAAKLVKGEDRKKLVIRDNTTKSSPKKEQAVIVRSQVQLALLSPFRFPLPQERVVGAVARYAGVFFVAVGALFSLIHLEYAGGTFAETRNLSHRAESIQSSSTGTNGAVNPVTTNTTEYQTPIQNTKPDVRISVEGASGSTISGMGVLMVTVPFASEVKMAAENTQEGEVTALGSAFRVDESTWRFYWDTRQYPNGPYKIRAVVKNQYGSYEYKDSRLLSVENVDHQAPVESPDESTIVTQSDNGTTSSDVTSETPETTPPPTTAPHVEIEEASPLTRDVPIAIKVSNAVEVRVYARNVDSAHLVSIGSARLQETDAWTIGWNTLLVVDGEYKIHAKVKLADGTYKESNIVTKNVENGVGITNTPITVNTASTTLAPASTDTAVAPRITTRIASPSPVSGAVDVIIETSEVEWVEIFAVKKSTLTPLFLGRAQKISNTGWKYVWSTKQSPNGEYNLYARVKTGYGFTEGERVPVRVFNQVVEEFTETQDETIGILTDVASELIRPTDGTEEVEEDSGKPYTPPKMVYIEPADTFVSKVDAEDDVKEGIEIRLAEFRTALNLKLNDLARAIRDEDAETLEKVRGEIEALKTAVLQELSVGMEKKEILDSINVYLSQITFELEEITTKNEAILKERIGDAVVKDSDKDGILDYDEINLYRTNPFAADTDGDSYIDSVEIRLGFNPHDSESESLLNYESPKETGVVREDLLEVSSITTLSDTEKETAEGEEVSARAMIYGKGLPNSFVTLYIYSTPIILTVKTDSEGSWSYVFDKELEEGNHEVYVGITDNAGRVVAKSNPLPFVKTAEAYTEEGAVAQVSNTSESEPTLVSEGMMLLVASIAVVALGLVLILLGFHVRGRQEKDMIVQNA